VNDVAELVHDVETPMHHAVETVLGARSGAHRSRTPTHEVERVGNA
jgi:hypothetical protein